MSIIHHRQRSFAFVTSLGWATMACAALVGCGSSASTPDSAASKAPVVNKTEPAPAVATTTAAKESSASAVSGVPAAEGWGSLTGKFVFAGPRPEPTKLDVNKDQEVCGKHNLINEELLVGPDGGIENVVIYVRSKDVKIHPDVAKFAQSKPKCDNNGCRFQPHILGVLVSQTCELHNSDSVAHNVNCQPLGDAGINPLIPPMGTIEHKFGRAQTIPTPITCNIHPWMKGYILPRDNPYFAITKPDGTFEIANLPSGELEFQAWHEKKGYLTIDGWDKGRFKHVIQPGDNSLGVKQIPASWMSN